MTSTKFSATLGVVPGYGHGNIGADAPAERIVASAWQQAAAEVMDATGVYVSAVVAPSLTVYATACGCPEGGEVSATVSGCQNLEFCPDSGAYRTAVEAVVARCKKLLRQSTVFIEYTEATTVYLK